MTAQLDAAPFSVTRRGYDRAEVEDRIGALLAEMTTLSADRDAARAETRTVRGDLEALRGEARSARSAAAEARAEVEALRAQVAELSTIPSTVDGMSERLQQMVRIAQDEVNEMRTRATTGAAHVLSLAQAEADDLRQRSEAERHDFESQRRTAEDALRAQLEESRARLEQLRNDSEGQKARLESELAEYRLRVEAEFAAEMDTRRSVLQQDLSGLEARQREEAGRIVDAATRDARRRVEEASTEAQRIRAEARDDVEAAHRELEGLRSLQHQVAEQLTSVRALLDWTLPQMPGAGRTGEQALPPDAPVPHRQEAEPTAVATVRTDPDDSTPVAPPSAEDGVPDPAPDRPSPATRAPRPGQNGRAGRS